MNNSLKFLLNCLIKKGKKSIAIKIFLLFFFELKFKLNKTPNLLIEILNNKIQLSVGLKKKKRRNNIILIPYFYVDNKLMNYSIRQFIFYSIKRHEIKTYLKLSNEFLQILQNKGLTVKHKENIHKQILENRYNLKYKK